MEEFELDGAVLPFSFCALGRALAYEETIRSPDVGLDCRIRILKDVEVRVVIFISATEPGRSSRTH
jgi:hypothetical protein